MGEWNGEERSKTEQRDKPEREDRGQSKIKNNGVVQKEIL